MTRVRRLATLVHRLRPGVIALLLLIVLAPVALAVRGADIRAERRRANNAQIELNRGKIHELELESRISTLLGRRTCEVQNENARAINRIVDYFESFAKAERPGPATDAFWASVPRPAAHRCSSSAEPIVTPQSKGSHR